MFIKVKICFCNKDKIKRGKTGKWGKEEKRKRIQGKKRREEETW